MENSPLFSVIVPTFNRPEALGRCLAAVSELRYPLSGFEVVVVNDEGTPVDQVVESFRGRFNLRLLHQKNTGPAQARNHGASLSAGKFLLFLDDDCCPAADWLCQWENSVRKCPENAWGGGTKNSLENNPFSCASQALLDYLYWYYLRDGYRPFVASNNLCVPAEAYRELGGFSREYSRAAAEDRDFCDAWLARGHHIGLAPDALVHHAHNLTLKSFWRQHFNYGWGAALFHRKRSERRGEKLTIEPLSFYTGLLTFPLRRERLGKGLAISLLLSVAQVANAAGFFSARIASHFRRQIRKPSRS